MTIPTSPGLAPSLPVVFAGHNTYLLSVARLCRQEGHFTDVVFHCADALEQTLDGTGQYYESIDLVDARHPQTLLAYDMNGEVLAVPHGAPLRLRVERQLGYKHAKYIRRIEAVESFDDIEGGKGGYWPDRGYAWYAGI